MNRSANRAICILGLCLAMAPITTRAGCVEAPANTWSCTDAPPNPDTTGILQGTNDNDITINVLAGAVIDTQANIDDNAIDLGGGDNVVSVTDATILAEDEAIESRATFELNLTRARVSSLAQRTIATGSNTGAPSNITIIDSTVTSVDNSVLNLSGGVDQVFISGSTIEVLTASGSDRAISDNDGNDVIELENSLLRGGTSVGPTAFSTINLAFGDDRLVLRNGVTLETLRPGNVIDLGLIDCGPGADTIEFAMDVLNAEVMAVQQAIAAADPAGDTVTINSETYQWVDCESLVDSVTGVEPPPPDTPATPARPPMPVPAISNGFQLFLVVLIATLGSAYLRRLNS